MITTIDQVVRASLIDQGYTTLHGYVLRLHFAIDGLYRLKRDSVYRTRKCVKLKRNSRNAVPYPDDMLAPIKIGVSIGNRILTFISDNSISLNKDDHNNDNNSAALTQ